MSALPYKYGGALILSLLFVFSSQVAASSEQRVVIRGVLLNTAVGIGSKATMNIGSVVGKSAKGVKQTVSVNGAVINTAAGSSQSTVNIGSIVAK